ncbi:MAG: peptidoglycan-binding protein [Candidatus Accumulibacter meliphilus]|jgi:peptidoglycan hydrolase-like protein with peptidoglycan-binding domain|uniref:peptidoglycan-binding domain-containing protein n=1 Tax=Candidatus Accumulibacter meliphilus TaxID=2211374 RepID=UPI002FC38E27
MHKMSCQCPKCQTGTGAEFQAFEFEAFDFEMSPQGEFEFEDESEDEALYEYGAVDEYEDEASFGSRDAESPFSDEEEAAAWDSERRRGRAASSARSKPQASPSRSRAKAGSRPTSPSRSRPPSRNARRLRSRFAAPAAPCVCPVHGTEYVRWIQSTLNQVESANLPVDGVMNAATRKALRRFQSRQGLPVDGIAGPEVEQALRDARRPTDAGARADEPGQDQGEIDEYETLELEAPTRMPTLRRGSRGSGVADLQRRLGAAGFNAGAADAIFGSKTDAAVRAFQRARGLAVDGIVGSRTWGALLGTSPSVPGGGGSATNEWLLPASVRTAGDAQTVRYDSPPAWIGMPGNCTGTFTAGAAALKAHILATFAGVSSIGGYSCRANSANRSETSVHGTGRALDIMIPTLGGRANSAIGDPIANWLVRNAAAIGVQYIIWNRMRWSGSRTPRVARYSGPNPHIDHVHVEINNDGARQRTPWFTNHGQARETEFEMAW